MGALRVLVAEKVTQVWEKLGLWKCLILGMCPVCRKYLDTQEYLVIKGAAQE